MCACGRERLCGARVGAFHTHIHTYTHAHAHAHTPHTRIHTHPHTQAPGVSLSGQLHMIYQAYEKLERSLFRATRCAVLFDFPRWEALLTWTADVMAGLGSLHVDLEQVLVELVAKGKVCV